MFGFRFGKLPVIYICEGSEMISLIFSTILFSCRAKPQLMLLCFVILPPPLASPPPACSSSSSSSSLSFFKAIRVFEQIHFSLAIFELLLLGNNSWSCILGDLNAAHWSETMSCKNQCGPWGCISLISACQRYFFFLLSLLGCQRVTEAHPKANSKPASRCIF